MRCATRLTGGRGEVLEKAGLHFEGILRRHVAFPQLDTAQPADVECWARTRAAPAP
jgi:hypothetical protein